MIPFLKRVALLLAIAWVFPNASSNAQSAVDTSVLLDYFAFQQLVLQNHPMAQQAQLLLTEGELAVLRAKGQFDPQLYGETSKKAFKGSEYFSLYEAGLLVPTQTGIDLKAGFEHNDGIFANPERTVPEEGLLAAGISIPVLSGIIINDRMLELRRSRLFREAKQLERIQMLNALLFESAMAYWDWVKAYRKLEIYREAERLARIRLQGIKQAAEAGELAAIDSVEAKTQVLQFEIQRRNSAVDFKVKTLKLSNFLWSPQEEPLQLSFDARPPGSDRYPALDLQPLEQLSQRLNEIQLWHPELLWYTNKFNQLTLERRQKLGKTLPKVKVDFSLLSATRSFEPDIANYKMGASLQYPLFTRRERADLRMTDLKLRRTELDIQQKLLGQQNKILQAWNEADNAQTLIDIFNEQTRNFLLLLQGEIQKFQAGESSLFLINSREQKYVKARLDTIEAIFRYYQQWEKLQFEMVNRTL